MRRRYGTVMCLWAACLALLCAGECAVAAPYDPVLTGLQHRKLSEKKEQIAIMMNGFYPPQISAAEGNDPRIICDFYDMRLGDGVARRMLTDGKYIKGVSISLHRSPAAKLRIVIDLSPLYDYVVKQVFASKQNAFIVIVERKGVKR